MMMGRDDDDRMPFGTMLGSGRALRWPCRALTLLPLLQAARGGLAVEKALGGRHTPANIRRAPFSIHGLTNTHAP
jgi:hypothetical protein